MTRATVRRALVLLCAIGLAALVGAAPAAADVHPERAGDLTIRDPNSGTAITHGGSTTAFVLTLPDGATCPGDSANDDWRTQGFLAPVGANPATFGYDAVGATGPGVFPLYEVDTSSYRHELLLPNDKAGEPGRIPNIPAMSFATYPPDWVPPGHYVLGIACTYVRATDKYWTVAVDVVKDPHDSPAQVTWSIAGRAATARTTSANRAPIVVAIVLLAAVLVVAFARRRRATVPLTSTKEIG